MFRRTKGDYNPKIDYKSIYFLNPLLDSKKNYYETVNIFKKRANCVSEQGKWFTKLNNAFTYLLDHELMSKGTFEYLARQFETTIDYKITSDIISQHLEISNDDVAYEATWLLQKITYKKPLNEYSDIMAVIMFNALLKTQGYIPIIFLNDYFGFIKRMIESNITVHSLKNLLSIYTDLSFKYDKKYEELSKQEIITLIVNNRNELSHLYGVKAIWLYGSFVRDEANEYSDIDLYVDLEDGKTEETLVGLKTYLESLLGRSVDMALESKVNKSLESNGLKEREVIFDDR